VGWGVDDLMDARKEQAWQAAVKGRSDRNAGLYVYEHIVYTP